MSSVKGHRAAGGRPRHTVGRLSVSGDPLLLGNCGWGAQWGARRRGGFSPELPCATASLVSRPNQGEFPHCFIVLDATREQRELRLTSHPLTPHSPPSTEAGRPHQGFADELSGELRRPTSRCNLAFCSSSCISAVRRKRNTPQYGSYYGKLYFTQTPEENVEHSSSGAAN